MKNIILITCMSKNRIIGKNNFLPWKIDEEINLFKKKTKKCPKDKHNVLIVGKRTYQNIKNIFDSIRKPYIFDGKIDPSKIIEKLLKNNKIYNIFIIGGAYTYKKFLKFANKIYLSTLHKEYDGDTYLPKIINKKWKLYERKMFDEFKFEIFIKQHEEQQYVNLVEKILYYGEPQKNTIALFVPEITKWNVENSKIPLLTTKQMFFKGIIEEFKWFCSGKTDVKILQKKGVNIWNKNSEKNNYDPGPIYSHQLRHFGAPYFGCDKIYHGFDQLKYVINRLKKNKNSRRILFSFWNPKDMEKMCLPPCHILYQFNVIDNRLSLAMYQRSGDVALGVPFNITSSCLFLHTISILTGIPAFEFIHILGNAHIYNSHIMNIKKQIKNKMYEFPTIEIKNLTTIEDIYKKAEYKIINYNCGPKIKYDLIV
jgi:thymidylate synthase